MSQVKIVQIDQRMMMNPIFPVRGMYTHSEYETAHDGTQMERYCFTPTAGMIGEKTTTTLIGKAEWYQDVDYLLAHSMNVDKFRVYKFEVENIRDCPKSFAEQIDPCFTHFIDIEVEMLAVGESDQMGRLIYISVIHKDYAYFFDKRSIKKQQYDNQSHQYKEVWQDVLVAPFTTFYNHFQKQFEYEGAV